MHKNRFCFKISADAGMAHDGEGNNSPAYIEVKFDTDKPLDGSEYTEAHGQLISALSKQIDIDSKHISPITQKEYDDNH